MPQIWRMAASGCDLQKLALNVAGLSTLEDSELNEAKNDNKKKEEEKKDSDKEDKKEKSKEESKEESKEREEKKDEDSEEQKGGQNPSGIAEENPNIPTKWVFLKITLKK